LPSPRSLLLPPCPMHTFPLPPPATLEPFFHLRGPPSITRPQIPCLLCLSSLQSVRPLPLFFSSVRDIFHSVRCPSKSTAWRFLRFSSRVPALPSPLSPPPNQSPVATFVPSLPLTQGLGPPFSFPHLSLTKHSFWLQPSSSALLTLLPLQIWASVLLPS